MDTKFKAVFIQKLKITNGHYAPSESQRIALSKNGNYIELDESEILELKSLLKSFEENPYY